MPDELKALFARMAGEYERLKAAAPANPDAAKMNPLDVALMLRSGLASRLEQDITSAERASLSFNLIICELLIESIKYAQQRHNSIIRLNCEPESILPN